MRLYRFAAAAKVHVCSVEFVSAFGEFCVQIKGKETFGYKVAKIVGISEAGGIGWICLVGCRKHWFLNGERGVLLDRNLYTFGQYQ